MFSDDLTEIEFSDFRYMVFLSRKLTRHDVTRPGRVLIKNKLKSIFHSMQNLVEIRCVSRICKASA